MMSLGVESLHLPLSTVKTFIKWNQKSIKSIKIKYKSWLKYSKRKRKYVYIIIIWHRYKNQLWSSKDTVRIYHLRVLTDFKQGLWVFYLWQRMIIIKED